MTTNFTATVNDSGQFRLEAEVAPGEYVVRAMMIGYTPAVHAVTVRDSGEISVPVFVLAESPFRLDDLIVQDYTCTRVDRRPARLPAGAWVRVYRDSSGREILTVCSARRH
jgi:hypothetical protein